MPIRANQDYWHKINELGAKEEQSQGEKTSQNLTALSGYKYLYKKNQLVAEVLLQINCLDSGLSLTQANMMKVFRSYLLINLEIAISCWVKK